MWRTAARRGRPARLARGASSARASLGAAQAAGALVLRPADPQGAGLDAGDPGVLLHRRARRRLGGARARRARLAGQRAARARARSYVGAAATRVSPPLLISDLGRPERFLNMLRVFKVTSPMSVGSWILRAERRRVERRRPRCELLGRAAAGAAARPRSARPRSAPPLADLHRRARSPTPPIPVWHEARRELPFLFARERRRERRRGAAAMLLAARGRRPGAAARGRRRRRRPPVISSEVARRAVALCEGLEISREVSCELGHGMESLASPRKLSGLRCSLDSARNDGYEIWFNIHLNMRLVVQKYGGHFRRNTGTNLSRGTANPRDTATAAG